MSNRSSIDWLELDRLVDGRLDGDAYRELLCQIDSDPDGWRQCAMAFLEHQALSKELSAFAMDSGDELLPFAGAGLLGNEPDVPSDNKQLAGLASKPSITAGKKSGSMIGWLTMALCIIGGTALGFSLQGEFQASGPVPMNLGATSHADNTFGSQEPAPPAIGADSQAKTTEGACDKPACGKRGCSPRCLGSRPNLNDDAIEGCGECPY